MAAAGSARRMPAPGYEGSFDVLIGVMAGLSAGRGGCRYGEDGTAEAVRPPALYCAAAAAAAEGELCPGDDAAAGEDGCGGGWAGLPPGDSAHVTGCPSDASWCPPSGCEEGAAVAGPSWSSEGGTAAGPSWPGGVSDGGAAEGETAGASSAGSRYREQRRGS